jgi:hypothetical protein
MCYLVPECVSKLFFVVELGEHAAHLDQFIVICALTKALLRAVPLEGPAESVHIVFREFDFYDLFGGLDIHCTSLHVTVMCVLFSNLVTTGSRSSLHSSETMESETRLIVTCSGHSCFSGISQITAQRRMSTSERMMVFIVPTLLWRSLDCGIAFRSPRRVDMKRHWRVVSLLPVTRITRPREILGGL